VLIHNYQIQKVTEDPDCWNARKALVPIHVNAKSKKLEASNGKALAIVSVTLEDGEELKEDFIPVSTWTAAKKELKKSIQPRLFTNEQGQHVDSLGRTYPKVEGAAELKYPDVEAVIRNPGDRPPDLVINPRLLLNLAQAISVSGMTNEREVGIALWFHRDGRGKIDFERAIYAQAQDGEGAYGVIMGLTSAGTNLRPEVSKKEVRSGKGT